MIELKLDKIYASLIEVLEHRKMSKINKPWKEFMVKKIKKTRQLFLCFFFCLPLFIFQEADF